MKLFPSDLITINAEKNLADYLAYKGWNHLSEGSFGVLWNHPLHGGEVGVPRGIRSGTGMWDGTISMIAQWENSSGYEVDKTVRRFWMDVSDFRAQSSVVRGNYIAAEAGSSLFSGAWKILRSSATTSRGTKIAIGGKYSSLGDRSIDGAMFAQTEPGSYILPLLVPIDRSIAEASLRKADHIDEGSPEDFFQTISEETEQRRATRTMAQALTAIYQKIIEPAVDPTMRAINETVVAGASREMVVALYDIINEETVSALDVTFSWAPKAGKISGVSSSVEVPKESAVLLERAAKQMKIAREPASALVSGPIFALYHPKGLDSGEATIEAAHRGRIRRITVALRGAEELDNAHRWFRGHETLLVEGAVRSTADGLKIDRPSQLRPLGQSLLF
ncbi:hypothetical protein GCM10027404_09710 [Arthrobacter tumbae]|uniref:hypothetical protein n=1 Tax=Arthrobacter tumbae TaxID=163874 RepID=UPI00195BC409|nr:hypothetical protein [Arthrobacter tumbae]MBM7782253.1 hypothetical protein [Arthrobacter tumbae]